MNEQAVWIATRRLARSSLAIVSAKQPLVRRAGHAAAADRLGDLAAALEAVLVAQDAPELRAALEEYLSVFDCYQAPIALALRFLDEDAGDA